MVKLWFSHFCVGKSNLKKIKQQFELLNRSRLILAGMILVRKKERRRSKMIDRAQRGDELSKRSKQKIQLGSAGAKLWKILRFWTLKEVRISNFDTIVICRNKCCGSQFIFFHFNLKLFHKKRRNLRKRGKRSCLYWQFNSTSENQSIFWSLNKKNFTS